MEIFQFNNVNVILILTITFYACFLIQLIYYLGIYSRIIFLKKTKIKIKSLPVSIIICTKNKAASLEKNLPSILTQNYPKYEVIVVNDCSIDNSEEILSKFKQKYSHLRTTSIIKDEKFSHGKKLALTIGIKAAKNEWLLLTDADCFAESKNWLSIMQKNFTEKTTFVLGYGGYMYKKGILNNFIRFDTLFIAMQYFSFALAGFPYMGVGRNLAYRKSVFFQNRGFASYSHLDSGDDDLFVNKIATKNNTKIELDAQSHTRSEPKTTLNEWIYQKRRHLTTGKYYNFKTKFLLGGEVVSRILFYILFILLTINNPFIEYILGAFILRLLIQLTIFKIAMNRLNEKYLLLSSLMFDIILPFFNLHLIILNFTTSKRTKWK